MITKWKKRLSMTSNKMNDKTANRFRIFLIANRGQLKSIEKEIIEYVKAFRSHDDAIHIK